MRVFCALVWRECFERRLLLLASAFLGIVPLLMPWMPGNAHIEPKDLSLAVMVVLTLLFGGLTLVILGSTIVGRDLSEDRLGFYFSRPISSWILWLSRIVAAYVLLCISLFLLVMPTLVGDFGLLVERFSSRRSGHAVPLLGFNEVYSIRNVWNSLPERPQSGLQLAGLLLVLLVLLVLTHATSTIIRGRNAWVLADLAGLAIVGVLGWSARNLMVQEEAMGALVWSEWLLIPWILMSGLIAGAVQLARGRTDLAGGHHYLSATLWSMLILGALTFNIYARYVASSSLGDLEDTTFVRPSPNDEWLAVGGPVVHRARAEAAFLVDSKSERSWRLGSLGTVYASLKFSTDNSTVAWVRCKSFSVLDCRVWTKDLNDADSPPRLTDVPFESRSEGLAISDDGSRVAYTQTRRLVVYDVSSGHLLAAIDAEQPHEVSFDTVDRIRFQELVDDPNRPRQRIMQLDIASRQKTELGRLPPGLRTFHSPRDGRILFTQINPPGFGLYDSAIGAQIGEVHARGVLPRQSLFLVDGRVVLMFRDEFAASLTVLSRDGAEEFTITGPTAVSGRFGGELSAGRVLVGFNEPLSGETPVLSLGPGLRIGWTTYVLDLETQQLDAIGVGVMPLGSPLGMPSHRLFMASGRTIIRWDPEATDYRTLLGPFRTLREGDLVFDPSANRQG